MALSAGSQLGPYEILSRLGSGGMGDVYCARDSRLLREVAIKILPPDVASHPARLKRFETEARSASALNHPNIVTIYDFGVADNLSYISMEKVDGKTLRQILSAGMLPIRKTLSIAAQISEGLSKAHASGIVHRDLKPENVMVTEDGLVKILDFGLAKLTEPETDSPQFGQATTVSGTTPGVVMGTVGYMSPEQARGMPVDFRSDQFSFGSMLYEMLTGKAPFRRASAVQTLAAVIQEEPPAIEAANSETPLPLRWIVERCIAKEARDRYDSTHDLVRDLAKVRDHLSSPSGGVAPSLERRARPFRFRPGYAAAALLLLAGLGFALLRTIPRLAVTPSKTLAVLPLANLSGDPQQDYFVDGLTEEITARLAKIGALRVTSRTSVMQFKDTKQPLPEIAKRLNVTSVVEGSITRVGDTVKVTAQLIDVATDKHLWAETYTRNVRDILSLQSEVAQAIAREIGVRMTGEERARVGAVARVDPQAFDAFVRGRYYWNQRELSKALDQFQHAIDADPTYAAAYAGLADTYALLGYVNDLAPIDSFPKAKAAASRALELQPDLAEAHAALGYINMYYDWDFPAAESEFERAIRSNPNSVTARHFYSVLLTAMLRPADARKQMDRARQLDPLSVAVASDMGFELYYDRDYQAAVSSLRDAIAMNPKAPFPHFWLARTYQAQGKIEQAISEFRAGGDGLALSPPNLAGLGHMYGVLGKRSEALQVLGEIQAMRAARKYVSPYSDALVYLGLNDKDQTFSWLEKSYADRANWLVWLRRDPRWDVLRNDPRFRDLLRRVGFPA